MTRKAKRQETVMNAGIHQFGQTPRVDTPRSSFDLSHGYKTTFDADYLIPVGVWDVIPGDSWNCRTTTLARLATPLHPLMDNIYIDTFYFFVPYRIIWDNFEKFMGAQDDPSDSIDFTIPIRDTGNIGNAGIYDYMGLPDNGVAVGEHNVLPMRAYYKIWNDYFRDENLQDSLTIPTDDGPDTQAYNVQKRGKRPDYFTSALPWPQKGTAIDIPIGTVAPIFSDANTGQTVGIHSSQGDTIFRALDSSGVDLEASTAQTADEGMFADLTNATGATINELRLAFKTQELLERDARSGTRYVETLKAHWGVTFPDYTAERPVYLGGGSQPLGITPVPQTTFEATPTADNTKGALAGYGETVGQAGFTKSFVEHGVIIALVNARSDITYSQGLDRMWLKRTRYEMMYPVLANIGEQSITNREIYHNNDAADNDVFGYTGRYNEYRFQNSKVTSLMRPNQTSNIASWNLSEEFTTRPTLGATFIESNTGDPLDRAIAVPSEPHFIADIFHDIKAARPLPLYGVPGGTTHF